MKAAAPAALVMVTLLAACGSSGHRSSAPAWLHGLARRQAHTFTAFPPSRVERVRLTVGTQDTIELWGRFACDGDNCAMGACDQSDPSYKAHPYGNCVIRFRYIKLAVNPTTRRVGLVEKVRVVSARFVGSPPSRLIVLRRSIGGISLGESRRAVERALGPPFPLLHGDVSYLGGRLIVDYTYHVRLTNRVQMIETTWPGFHLPSGGHVGLPPAGLGNLPVHIECTNTSCGTNALPSRGAPATIFWLRHGRVARIQTVYTS